MGTMPAHVYPSGANFILFRPLDKSGRAVWQGLLDRSRTAYRSDSAAAEGLLATGIAPRNESFDAAELAAWTVVSRVLLNLDETVTKE